MDSRLSVTQDPKFLCSENIADIEHVDLATNLQYGKSIMAKVLFVH